MSSVTAWLLILAIIAGALAFGGIAGPAAGLAKVAFVSVLLLAVLGFLLGRSPKRRP